MRLPPPPLVALGAAIAQRAVARPTTRPTVLRAVGCGVVVLASGALATSAAREFRARGTTLNPVDPAEASALVTTGPNAITRNPMYLGLTGLLAANAIRLGSWRGLLPVGAFVVAMDRLQIAAEEAALRTRFGEEYDAYRRAVPRWLDGRSLALGREVGARLGLR
jgi:protein-S-isoprenylcysteine O-methyltransferase Ste14